MAVGRKDGRVRIGVGRWGAALGVALAFFAPSRAQANCVAPEPEVLWSWPADGAVDVPIDSDLLLATQGVYGATLRITLSGGGLVGVAIEAGSGLPGHFDLGALAPHTHYSLNIVGTEIGALQNAGRLVPFVGAISFETGEGQSSSEGGELPVRSFSEVQPGDVSPFDSEGCGDILMADTCFDTGEPLLLTFDVDVSSLPIDPRGLWVIETIFPQERFFRVVPTSCGKPAHLGFISGDIDYRVYDIGPNGAIRESDILMGPEAPPPLLPPPPRVAVPQVTPDATGAMCDLAPGAGKKGARGAVIVAAGVCAAVLGRRAQGRKGR